MNITLEQRRMRRAYDAIEHVRDAKQRETLINAVKGLGPEIQRCGLLQALAFLHRGPTKDIAETLCQEIRAHLVTLRHLGNRPPAPSFLVEVRDLDRVAYMRITRETMALALWLKRAAEVLGKEKE